MTLWQERVAMHHINGDSRDNSPDNVCFVHIAARAILTEAERDEYRRYLMWQRHDPVLDYLDSLRWDGEPRLEAFDPLPPGGVVGSGETVKQTSAGVRTPRGKIEIVLEKDGKRRLAIWGASTTINVQRMQQ